MGSILHRSGVLIAFIILISHFEFYVKSHHVHTRSKDHISQWCSSSNSTSSSNLGSSPIPCQHPRHSGHRSQSLTVNSISPAPSNSQAAPPHTTVQRSRRTLQSTPTPNPASTIVPANSTTSSVATNPDSQQSNPTPTPTSTSTSTSTSSYYPPWPTTTGPAGFHIVMFYSPDNTDFALAVVGSANSNNCSTIIANQTSYGAYSYFPDGSDASIWDHTFPNNVNSSVEFYVQGKGSIDNNTAELPLCGVASPRNFKLIFHSTWTQNGPGAFGFLDSLGNTGTCILTGFITSCLYSGTEYFVKDLMACEADGNPSYCAGY
ncbi:hypothetical protein V8E54_011424 [Elaphomyces granulatus]